MIMISMINEEKSENLDYISVDSYFFAAVQLCFQAACATNVEIFFHELFTPDKTFCPILFKDLSAILPECL